MAHVIKLAEDFQQVDKGKPRNEDSSRWNKRSKRGGNRAAKNPDEIKPQSSSTSGKEAPVYLYSPHKVKGLRQ